MTASAASGPVTTWGGRAGRIALAAASFAIAGVALEVALRLLGAGPVPVNPDQRSLWAYHPKLGWTSRAGYEGTFDNGFFSVHVAINSRGLRGDEVSLQKPVGVRRVLVVGDSFGWGFGVEQEDTFGARLERALPDTEVINGAVSGYSTDQVLLWLRLEGRQYAPDVVVYALSGNDDIMNHMQVAYWTYYKPTYGLDRHAGLLLQGVPVPKAGLSDRLRHSLRSRSAVAKALEIALLGHEASFVYLADSYPDPSDPHRLTVALVNALRSEAHRAGASLVVVANSQFWFSPSGSYERLVAELRRASHDVVDVESRPGWEPTAMQIPGDGHWNARGHAFVARLLAERLGAGDDSAVGENSRDKTQTR